MCAVIFISKMGVCGALKFYFVVSCKKSVVLFWCSACIQFKVQFCKSTSPYKVSRAGQGYILVILSAVFQFFHSFLCSIVVFGPSLCPLLKQEVHAVYVPLSMKMRKTLLFDIDINL